MNIIVAGLGLVGYPLSKALAAEGHNVTCIDTDGGKTALASEALDVLALQGSCTSVQTLKEAGAARADVFVAVCRLDEVNMVACLLAKQLGTKHTVARIRDPQYADELDTLEKAIGIDMVLNPEYDTAAQLLRLLRFPNAQDIDTFFNGRVELVGFRVREDDFIVGRSLAEIQKKPGHAGLLFCAVEHNGTTVIPNGSTVISSGDNVYVIGDIKSVNGFFKTLGRISQKIRSVFIIGGGKTTVYLGKMMEALNFRAKIIEKDAARCRELCEELPDALILNGDGTEQEVLITENVNQSDSFVALTGDDEDNLIISLYAKKLGVDKVIAKINRQDYYDVISALNIDSFINPKLVTVYTILRFIRGIKNSRSATVEALYQIAGGTAEAAELTVNGKTKHIGQPLKELGGKIKHGILLVSILRDGSIIIPEGSTSILEGDKIIIVSNTVKITAVNDIFTD